MDRRGREGGRGWERIGRGLRRTSSALASTRRRRTDMVCPLRFVVVGISAVLALIIAWFGLVEGNETTRTEEEENEGRRKDGNVARLLWDMVTGRYLYDRCCEWKGRKQTRSAAKAT